MSDNPFQQVLREWAETADVTPGRVVRFVNRDGKLVLQQLWIGRFSGRSEWVDVPIVDELPSRDARNEV